MIDTRDGGAGRGGDIMNKTMSELRQEHGLEPGLHSAASKLRMQCSFYSEKYADTGDKHDEDD